MYRCGYHVDAIYALLLTAFLREPVIQLHVLHTLYTGDVCCNAQIFAGTLAPDDAGICCRRRPREAAFKPHGAARRLGLPWAVAMRLSVGNDRGARSAPLSRMTFFSPSTSRVQSHAPRPHRTHKRRLQLPGKHRRRYRHSKATIGILAYTAAETRDAPKVLCRLAAATASRHGGPTAAAAGHADAVPDDDDDDDAEHRVGGARGGAAGTASEGRAYRHRAVGAVGRRRG